MQVILMNSRLTSARSVTLTNRHLVLLVLLFIGAVFISATLLYYLTFRHADRLNLPLVNTLITSATQDNADKKDKYVKENLAAMAVKLGEMQAQLMRLDALGERVQSLAGIKPEEFNFKELPGRGGATTLEVQGKQKEEILGMTEFRQMLDSMAKGVEHRADYMNVVETKLMGYKVKSKLLPTIQPVNGSYSASGFGWRLDPFSGRHARHEGIDFPSPIGTPIHAAAGGVVVTAEFHHQYGNMLEIDHGNNIVTRYAHASKLSAKVGDIVKRGQQVAQVGSTGRSTGPHLHFEVLVKGVQQDPNKFLVAGSSPSKLAMLTRN